MVETAEGFEGLLEADEQKIADRRGDMESQAKRDVTFLLTRLATLRSAIRTIVETGPPVGASVGPHET